MITGGSLDLGTTTQTTGDMSIFGGSIVNGTLHSATYDLETATISATLNGGAVTKDGIGTVTLSAANTYSNGTTVTSGTLEAAHQTAGTIDALSGGEITMNGGTLRTTVTGTYNNNLTFAANASSVISAAAGQTVTFGPNGGASVFTLGDNSIATFGSPTDTGTVILFSTSNTIFPTAQIVVAGGTLQDGNGTLGNATSSITSTTVNAGATLDMNDQTDVIHNLLGAGTVITGNKCGDNAASEEWR